MELKLKAKAEEQENNEVGIAESPKSKFFTTRGCGDKFWECIIKETFAYKLWTGKYCFPYFYRDNNIWYCHRKYLKKGCRQRNICEWEICDEREKILFLYQ
ncbi:MAG: hypothetical protein KatS3mg129_2480 [Leptospiraceae bacterium]|nr:MAG: hypothetical protein KatS3mg129_2480 [Leptospiraceae bacterium]